MLRKTIIALLAVAALGLVSPTGAFARGGGGGHGGGFHGGGFHGGGFRGGGWGGWGLGFGYPYYYGGDCYLVRRRVLTRYGWRIRRVEICD